jgi:hypothetical protein
LEDRNVVEASEREERNGGGINKNLKRKKEAREEKRKDSNRK